MTNPIYWIAFHAAAIVVAVILAAWITHRCDKQRGRDE